MEDPPRASTHIPSPITATPARYGTASNKPKLPRSSVTQIRSARASTAVARYAGAPEKLGSSRERRRAAPSQAKAARAPISATPGK